MSIIERFRAAVYYRYNLSEALKIINEDDFDIGIKILIYDGEDQHFVTPFLYAAFAGNIEVAKALLKKGSDIQEVDDRGWSAIDHCHRNKAVVDFLLGEGFNAKSGICSATFRRLAGSGMSEYTVKRLIDGGVDVNARSELGSTALMEAFKGDWDGMVELLLDSGCDLNRSDNLGQTALFFAVSAFSQEKALMFVQSMVELGADVSREDARGNTAIDIARQAERNKILEYLEARLGYDHLSKVIESNDCQNALNF